MKEIDFTMKEIATWPPKGLEEIADYISYMKYKYKINDQPIKIDEITLASKEGFVKDWLRLEEDEVWKDLSSNGGDQENFS
ncbi:hypothetical protein [Thermotalea metallivorans]|uniref:DUF2281 domain-containing protein n=1 Tax=Thermotalea metallivorans TaxID=520762 RepID=A0A140L8Z7_9FIRM|nr:hypothetical protein [Thermotalea metallivorans]KXG77022.1 hypothetical protein AN619_05500 [Thermotalea metallivorans]